MKWTTKDNDNLRWEFSRIKVLAEYTNDRNVTEKVGSKKCDNDDLQTANTKLDNLRAHVADIAHMLFSLVGEKRSEVSAAATTRHQQQLSQPAPTFNETFPISVM